MGGEERGVVAGVRGVEREVEHDVGVGRHAHAGQGRGPVAQGEGDQHRSHLERRARLLLFLDVAFPRARGGELDLRQHQLHAVDDDRVVAQCHNGTVPGAVQPGGEVERDGA